MAILYLVNIPHICNDNTGKFVLSGMQNVPIIFSQKSGDGNMYLVSKHYHGPHTCDG